MKAHLSLEEQAMLSGYVLRSLFQLFWTAAVSSQPHCPMPGHLVARNMSEAAPQAHDERSYRKILPIHYCDVSRITTSVAVRFNIVLSSIYTA